MCPHGWRTHILYLVQYDAEINPESLMHTRGAGLELCDFHFDTISVRNYNFIRYR